MNSGFANLRSSLPMNLKGHYPGFKVWSRAQGDIQRVLQIWQECLQQYGGPYLFGARRTMADAMFAPVTQRFLTYAVALDRPLAKFVCGRDQVFGNGGAVWHFALTCRVSCAEGD